MKGRLLSANRLAWLAAALGVGSPIVAWAVLDGAWGWLPGYLLIPALMGAASVAIMIALLRSEDGVSGTGFIVGGIGASLGLLVTVAFAWYAIGSF